MKNKKLQTILILIGIAIIIATGFCVWKMNKDMENVNTNQNEIQEINTSDWQKYKNEDYGFEVKYPQDWEISKLPDPKAGFLLESQNYSEKIYLSKTGNYNNLGIIELIETFDDASSSWPQEFPYRNITINGKDTIVFDTIISTKKGNPIEGKPKRKKVFIKVKDYVFIASYLYDEKNEDTEKIFNQIVKEIQFVGSLDSNIPTSDWKTYVNEEYGFEVEFSVAYENNNIYYIWDTKVNKNGYSWGINKHQETVIAIEAYPKNVKEELFKEKKYKLLNEKVSLSDDIIADKIDYYGEILFVERDNFIYFIETTFSQNITEEYNEYKNILKTLKIK